MFGLLHLLIGAYPFSLSRWLSPCASLPLQGSSQLGLVCRRPAVFQASNSAIIIISFKTMYAKTSMTSLYATLSHRCIKHTDILSLFTFVQFFVFHIHWDVQI